MERRCAVSRVRAPASAMIRFALGPDHRVVPDITRKLPGRGVWIMARHGVVERAAREDRFSRAFRTKAKADDDLAAMVANLLCQRALGYLSLASKAGVVVTGFEKVRKVIGGGDVRILITASDGAPGGAEKLRQRARTATPATAGGPVEIDLFNIAELSLALGGSNVVHAAVTKHDLAERLVAAARKYGEYCADSGHAAGPGGAHDLRTNGAVEPNGPRKLNQTAKRDA